MSDSASQPGRIPLPLAFGALAFFFGAMKFEGFRPLGAQVAGFALPVGVVWAAQARLVDTHPALRRAAIMLGAVVIAVTGIQVARVLLGVTAFEPHPLAYRWVLVAVGLGAVVLEGIAARRSLRVRVAAWFGVALGFASYLAGAPLVSDHQNPMKLVFMAGLVGLWIGGLSGLVLGAGAARLARAPAKDDKATSEKPRPEV